MTYNLVHAIRLEDPWIVVQMIRYGPRLPIPTDNKDVFVLVAQFVYQTSHVLITMM